MSIRDAYKSDDARFATLLDESGNPPCHPPDDCDVCVLFTGQRPGETRAAWLARITEQIQISAQRRAS